MTGTSTAMPALALLAGGLATRLRPRTLKLPKAMLPVAGEPFIAHQLRLIAREGVRRVVICAAYLADQLEAFVGSGARFGIEVAYSLDGSTLLGTGGALKKASSLLGDPFLVMYGDSYLDVPYRPVVEAFNAAGKPALMTIYRNAGLHDQSNIEYFGGEIRRYDKRARSPAMEYIDYGLGVLSARALAQWPDDRAFDLADIYAALVSRRELAAFEVHHRFYEIGSEAGIAEMESYLLTQRNLHVG